MGMLRPSAKVVILRARPSGPKSSRILTASWLLSLPSFVGIGILDGFGDPEPAAVVEVDVERLVDVRLGGDELDLEAGRQVEAAGLVGRRAGVGVGDVHLVGEGQAG